MRIYELNHELAIRQAESSKTAHQRAGKSNELGIRQTQGKQSLTAPRDQTNTGQKPSRQAKNRRHRYHRAKEGRWLKPCTGRVEPEVPQSEERAK